MTPQATFPLEALTTQVALEGTCAFHDPLLTAMPRRPRWRHPVLVGHVIDETGALCEALFALLTVELAETGRSLDSPVEREVVSELHVLRPLILAAVRLLAEHALVLALLLRPELRLNLMRAHHVSAHALLRRKQMRAHVTNELLFAFRLVHPLQSHHYVMLLKQVVVELVLADVLLATEITHVWFRFLLDRHLLSFNDRML